MTFPFRGLRSRLRARLRPTPAPAHDPLLDVIQKIKDSSLFDAPWYRETYPGVIPPEGDPVDHYVRVGAAEGRDPGPGFDTTWYCNRYPDVTAAGLNPLYHFLMTGQIEERRPLSNDGIEAFEAIATARAAGNRGFYAHSRIDHMLRDFKALDAELRRLREQVDNLLLLPAGVDGRRQELHDSLDPVLAYRRWVWLYDTITEEDRKAIEFHVERLAFGPLISIVMPVYNPTPKFLRAAITSVRNQIYPNWELCIADDASTDPIIANILAAASREDSRIKTVRREKNGHISACTNSALELATGEFVAFMDHDDLLREHALYEVAVALNREPALDLLYSDEDHIDDNGRRDSPTFKSQWNAELVLTYNLTNHLSVYRRSVVESLGGLRAGFEGSQDYDLLLRAMRVIEPGRIRHIPMVLYHWRRGADAPAYSEAFLDRCVGSARRAIAEYLEATGQKGSVGPHPTIPTWHRVRRDLPEPAPLVSIIVPTKDKPELIGRCVEGLLARTDYPAMEILIVDNGTTDTEALTLLSRFKADGRVRVLPYPAPFNYSAINNFAVREAKGEFLLLLNNDIDVIEPHWLSEMVCLAVPKDVGAVGAKLLYPDGLVQHAGVILGTGGVAGHYFQMLDRSDVGRGGRAAVPTEVSAVTAACLLVRKTVFDQVGGFDDVNLPVSFNDVDLCLRIGREGYRNIWTPYAELFHHESASRGPDDHPAQAARVKREVAYMFKTWNELLPNDPFYNPNLSLLDGDFRLACPPRRARTWVAPA